MLPQDPSTHLALSVVCMLGGGNAKNISTLYSTLYFILYLSLTQSVLESSSPETFLCNSTSQVK